MGWYWKGVGGLLGHDFAFSYRPPRPLAWRRVDEEEHGGHSVLLTEGMPSTVALYLVRARYLAAPPPHLPPSLSFLSFFSRPFAAGGKDHHS